MDPQTSGNRKLSAELSNSDAVGVSGVIGDADLSSLGFTSEFDVVPQTERLKSDIKDDIQKTNGAE